MDRRNFSLMAVTGLLGLGAAKSANADAKRSKDTYKHNRNLTGTFHTIGNGSSLGGIGDLIDGIFETGKDSQEQTTNGSFTFNKNGSGVSEVRFNKVVNEFAAKNPYNERSISSYEFTYEVTDIGEISLFIKQNSLVGEIIDGPRKGKSFNTEIIMGDMVCPHLEGNLSPDGLTILLSTKEQFYTKTIYSDEIEIDEISNYSIIAVRG